MKNKKVKDLTIISMFAAIITLLTFVPYIGYINLGFVSITDIHVIVIIGAIVLGPKKGLILGTVFGVTSLIRATYGEASDITFLFPWVSILPRAIFGWFVGWFYLVLRKVKINIPISIGIVALVGTVVHTVLVFIPYLPTYVIMNGFDFGMVIEGSIANSPVSSPIVLYCMMVFGFNCIFESLLALVVSVPLVTALIKILKSEDTDEIDEEEI